MLFIRPQSHQRHCSSASFITFCALHLFVLIQALHQIDAADFNFPHTTVSTRNNEGEQERQQHYNDPAILSRRKRRVQAQAELQLSPAIIEKFKADAHLLDNFDVMAHLEDYDGDSLTFQGQAYDMNDVSAVESIFTRTATYSIDGVTQSSPPPDAVFRSNQNPDLIVTKTPDGRILRGNLGETELVPVLEGVANNALFVAVRPENTDPEKIQQYRLEDPVIPGNRRRRSLLREQQEQQIQQAQSKAVKQDQGRRSLLNCNSFKVIEMAIAFDKTFCSQFGNGNKNDATAQVQSIIREVSEQYKQDGLCTRVKISHIEGYCSGNDPYEPFIKDNNRICNEPSAIFDSFSDYWRRERSNVARDVAHLFYGNKQAPNRGVIGCAAFGGVCSKQDGYGVNEVGFDSTLSKQTTLVSHELGHNVGGNHDSQGGSFIMSPYLCECDTFSDFSVNQISSHLDTKSCITKGAGDPDDPDDSGNPPQIFCFSGANSVHVLGKGLVPMNELQIGDYVSTGGNKNDVKFSRVYSFGHFDDHVEAEFLQISASGLKTPLEVTPLHLIFANDKMRPASQVKVGDVLAGDYKVSSITTVKRRGLYAPFTESGDLLVSGVLASNYVRVLEHSPVDQHFACHAALAPLRLLCAYDFEICKNESYTDGISDFVLYWAKLAERFQTMSAPIHVAFTVAIVPLAVGMYWLEQLLTYSPVLIVCSACLMLSVWSTFFKSWRAYQFKKPLLSGEMM